MPPSKCNEQYLRMIHWATISNRTWSIWYTPTYTNRYAKISSPLTKSFFVVFHFFKGVWIWLIKSKEDQESHDDSFTTNAFKASSKMFKADEEDENKKSPFQIKLTKFCNFLSQTSQNAELFDLFCAEHLKRQNDLVSRPFQINLIIYSIYSSSFCFI